MDINPAGRYLVLDVETQKGFNEVDRKRLHLLKISVVCVYDSSTEKYSAFEEKEILKLEDLLKQADLIVGFNIRDFDLEVLAPYLLTPIKNLPPVLDLLVEFEKARGHRVSLQGVAQATLGRSKTGTGWDAIRLYQDGRMAELKEYCTEDVRLTKDIYEYGCRHGQIQFISNRDYQVHDVPVTWGNALAELKEKKKIENRFPTSLF